MFYVTTLRQSPEEEKRIGRKAHFIIFVSGTKTPQLPRSSPLKKSTWSSPTKSLASKFYLPGPVTYARDQKMLNDKIDDMIVKLNAIYLSVSPTERRNKGGDQSNMLPSLPLTSGEDIARFDEFVAVEEHMISVVSFDFFTSVRAIFIASLYFLKTNLAMSENLMRVPSIFSTVPVMTDIVYRSIVDIGWNIDAQQ